MHYPEIKPLVKFRTIIYHLNFRESYTITGFGQTWKSSHTLIDGTKLYKYNSPGIYKTEVGEAGPEHPAGHRNFATIQMEPRKIYETGKGMYSEICDTESVFSGQADVDTENSDN